MSGPNFDPCDNFIFNGSPFPLRKLTRLYCRFKNNGDKDF